ncbi:unnamed protein product, partial [marine sediment metagenome]
ASSAITKLLPGKEELVNEVQFLILTGGALTDFRMPYRVEAVWFWGGSFRIDKKPRLA